MPLLKGLRHANRQRTFALLNHRQPLVPNSTQAAAIRFASRWHEGVRLGRLPGAALLSFGRLSLRIGHRSGELLPA